MMTAVIINAMNWRNIPSFSDIPIWSTLAVFVSVFDACPLGRVSRVEIESENKDWGALVSTVHSLKQMPNRKAMSWVPYFEILEA